MATSQIDLRKFRIDKAIHEGIMRRIVCCCGQLNIKVNGARNYVVDNANIDEPHCVGHARTTVIRSLAAEIVV